MGMKRVLIPLLAVVFCGCATLKQLLSAAFVPPTLTFQSASLADVNLEGVTLNLNYAIDNPNPVAIDLAQVQYALAVEGKHVVSGTPPQGLHLAANGKS